MAQRKLPPILSDSVSLRVSRTLAKAASAKFSGFTLAELIVVIAILAVLATIGFLALSGYSSDARDAKARANVRSVHSAVASESALTGNSPRWYVSHDPDYALSWAYLYVDGNPVALTGGNVGEAPADSNYAAGQPRWDRLKLDPEKFRTSGISGDSRFAAAFAPLLPGTLRTAFFPSASAAFDKSALSMGAADAPTSSANGRTRTVQFFQTAGILPETGAAVVFGNFPAPSEADLQTSESNGKPVAVWLVRNPDANPTDALIEDTAVSNSNPDGEPDATPPSESTVYPGCDTPDIVIQSNGQVWSACNVGATTAYVNQAYPAATVPRTLEQKAWMGALFQWGRNDDVTASATTSVRAPAGTLAHTVWHSDFILAGGGDWMNVSNANLWWGGSTTMGTGTFSDQTVENQSIMRGPCAEGYHVPTSAEWRSAALALVVVDTTTECIDEDEDTGECYEYEEYNDYDYTALRTTLKIPYAGVRYTWGDLTAQGQWPGNYWTSTPSLTNTAIDFEVNYGHPHDTDSRSYGLPVRCLRN